MAKSTKRRKASHRRTVRHRARSSNPAKRRRTTYHPVKRRRRTNPASRGVRHVRRHHRNPGIMGHSVTEVAMQVAAAVGGGIASRSVPQMVAAMYNTGFVGYLLNLAVAIGSGALLGRWKPALAWPWTLGGLMFTASRVIDDFTGQQLLTFAQFTPGGASMLSGDAGYGIGLAGTFATLPYSLPSNVNDIGHIGAPPMAALPPAPPAKGLGRARSWAQSWS